MPGHNRDDWTDGIHFRDIFGVFVTGPDDVEFRTGTTSGRSIVVSDSERRGILGNIIEKLVSAQTALSRPWNEAELELLDELMPQLQENGIIDFEDARRATFQEPASSFALVNKPMSQARIAIVGHGVLGQAVRGLLRGLPCKAFNFIESSSVAKSGEFPVSTSQSPSSATQPIEYGEPIPRPAGHDKWLEVLNGHDWIIAAQDCFEPEELAALNRAALQMKLPWSLVCFDGYEGWVGPTFVPERTACFSCFRQRLFAGATEPKHVFSDPGVKVYRPSSPWSIGAEAAPWLSLIASMFALDVIAAMEGKGFTLNNFLVVHRLNLTFQRESVLRLPRCEDCSPVRNAPSLNVFANLLSTRGTPRTVK